MTWAFTNKTRGHGCVPVEMLLAGRGSGIRIMEKIMASELQASCAVGHRGHGSERLRAKYRAERDRRLRVDGTGQYVETRGRFAHYLDDPYADPTFTRAPVNETIEVAILGGGFGGLLAAARLVAVGISDVRLIKKAGDFGGTWYWNRYPGAACDTEAYIYMPLLEEVGYIPTTKYAKAPAFQSIQQRAFRAFSDQVAVYPELAR